MLCHPAFAYMQINTSCANAAQYLQPDQCFFNWNERTDPSLALPRPIASNGYEMMATAYKLQLQCDKLFLLCFTWTSWNQCWCTHENKWISRRNWYLKKRWTMCQRQQQRAQPMTWNFARSGKIYKWVSPRWNKGDLSASESCLLYTGWCLRYNMDIICTECSTLHLLCREVIYK